MLGMPDALAVRNIAARVSSGLVVVLATDEQVRSARRELRDVENVMFVPATPDEIPWQDAYFTRVIDTCGGWPDAERVSREIQRVLSARS